MAQGVTIILITVPTAVITKMEEVATTILQKFLSLVMRIKEMSLELFFIWMFDMMVAQEN